MLEVELDIFSGMPNPKWVLSEREEKELLDRLIAEPTQVSPTDTSDEQFSLGYRGLIVREIKTDTLFWQQTLLESNISLPNEFRVGSKPASLATAQWLLQSSERAYKQSRVTDELREVSAAGIFRIESSSQAIDPVTATMATFESDPEYDYLPSITGEDAATPFGGDEIGAQGATWWACGSNYFTANAAVFNTAANVGRNNCYPTFRS